ncbi:MAG: hypothetical protein RLZZ182_1920 [Pseudomonadota bacterium]|jgi:hypothetical protein
MDSSVTDTSAPLDTASAASLFASMLDDAPQEPVKQEAAPQPAEEPKPEAAEPAADTPADDNEPTVTVKIDGKDVEVKLSELTKGYQTAKASTLRFEEASHTKRQAESELAKVRQERQATMENLQRVRVQLEGVMQAQQQNVDWDKLLTDDPAEYLRQQHLAQKRQVAHQTATAELQRIAQLQQAEHEQGRKSYLIEQHEQLMNAVPEWKDPTKAQAEKAALREYLLSAGYAEDAVASVSDAKAVLLARKAMLYDQIMSKANAEAKRVPTLPNKSIRPGAGEAPNVDRRTASYQKLAKSGKVEDAAAVFASLL